MPFDTLLSGAFWGQFVLLTLFGAVLIAIGVACGLAVARHRRTSPSEVFSDADIEFMAELATYDKEAARMAKLASRQSQDPAVRALALDVIAEQCERVGRVAGWRDLGVPAAERPLETDTGPLLMLRRATGRRFDVLFLEWLQRNREDTTAVAESVLDETATPAVTLLAEDILARHERQQGVLRDMAADRGRRNYR